MNNEAGASDGPHLRRSLTLWDLILYGIIVLQPVAPMSAFGALSDRGRGHVVTAILIAMVAMLATAVSYGKMASVYPSAGSAFTYVAREIHPAAGYITGWSMVMDYIVNPLICTIWCAGQAHEFAPAVPDWGWKIFFAVVFTLLNLQGIKTSARVNAGLAAAMSCVVVVVFVTTIRYIFGHPHSDPGFFTRPFYDPKTFTFDGLFGCTSLAVLTYIGFDGISTLSEEAENPRRNILLATVMTCLAVGILSASEVYVVQLVWPGIRTVSQPGYGVCLRSGTSVGADVQDCWSHAAGGELWLRDGSADRRGTIALRNGNEQCAAEVFFWRSGCETRHSPEQRAFHRRDSALGFFFSHVRTRHRAAEFWRANRVHGRECVFLHALFREAAGEKADGFCCAHCGIFYLPRSVVESEQSGENRGNHLDGGRDRVWHLENEVVPRTAVL